MSVKTLLADRIRVKRAELRLSQAQLAKLCETHQTQVSDWENGRGEPKNGQLSKLADALQVSADWLLGREAVSPSPSG